MLALAIAAINTDWVIATADVSQAYVASELRSPVLMKAPKELIPILIEMKLCEPRTADKAVLRLKRSLYGLVQSGRNWHSEIAKSLVELGWHELEKDPCVFCLKGEGGPRAILNVYVDDLLFLGEAALYDVVLKQLQERYDITSMLRQKHTCVALLGSLNT